MRSFRDILNCRIPSASWTQPGLQGIVIKCIDQPPSHLHLPFDNAPTPCKSLLDGTNDEVHLVDQYSSIHYANVTHSHAEGDMVLNDIMVKCVRESDYVIRFDGEEFVVLFPESSDKVAQATAERIRQMLAGHVFSTASDEFGKTISIGISVFPEDCGQPFRLFGPCLQGPVQAKEQERNRVVRYVAHNQPA